LEILIRSHNHLVMKMLHKKCGSVDKSGMRDDGEVYSIQKMLRSLSFCPPPKIGPLSRVFKGEGGEGG